MLSRPLKPHLWRSNMSSSSSSFSMSFDRFRSLLTLLPPTLKKLEIPRQGRLLYWGWLLLLVEYNNLWLTYLTISHAFNTTISFWVWSYNYSKVGVICQIIIFVFILCTMRVSVLLHPFIYFFYHDLISLGGCTYSNRIELMTLSITFVEKYHSLCITSTLALYYVYYNVCFSGLTTNLVLSISFHINGFC